MLGSTMFQTPPLHELTVESRVNHCCCEPGLTMLLTMLVFTPLLARRPPDLTAPLFTAEPILTLAMKPPEASPAAGMGG